VKGDDQSGSHPLVGQRRQGNLWPTEQRPTAANGSVREMQDVRWTSPRNPKPGGL
ncbi:MAG: hypothetical protein AVDCRST_MAG87-940, partial [uncultured Thermomicrobiales bacterium]